MGSEISGSVTVQSAKLCEQKTHTSSISDEDHWVTDCDSVSEGHPSDSITYSWSWSETPGTNPQTGTFVPPTNQSSVTWQAPPCTGTVNIKLTANDVPNSMDNPCPDSTRDDSSKDFEETSTVSLPSGCSAGSQTVSLYLIETCCPGCSDPDHCGETWYPTRYSGPDIDADYSDCHWEFSVSDIWSSDSDPCPSNFTEITDGDDPDLNESNYCGIVNIFRNSHRCAKVGGTNYGNASCTEIHEDCHYDFMEGDLETTEEEWLKAQSSMSNMTIDCSNSATTTCQAAVNARESAILLDLALAYKNAWDYMKAQDEQPCYDAAGTCYEDIADSICAVWDCNSC